MTQTARSLARANEDAAIASNVAKIEGAKRANALQVMASRLNVSADGLKNTLLQTVFKKATDEEFTALVIVANAYGLNPLTKEIYAFPAKGGGIVPVVSIDGWLRIMNEHPQFDGIEFEDIPDDKGKLIAVEAVIWRKDRTRPIKVTEYLDECQMGTDPWKKMPARMLRHKATIQCARYAFGFAGIHDEEEAGVIAEISLAGNTAPPPPMRQAKAITDGKPTEVDEETARALDAGIDPQTGEVLTGRTDAQHGDQHTDDSEPPYKPLMRDWAKRVEDASILGDVLAVEGEFDKHKDALPEDDARNVANWIATAKARFGK